MFIVVIEVIDNKLLRPEMGDVLEHVFERYSEVAGIQFNWWDVCGDFYGHLVMRDDAAAQLIDLHSLENQPVYTGRPVFHALSRTPPSL